MFPYLADWLVRYWSRSQVLSSMVFIQSTFNALGRLSNIEKSILTPVQRIEFIGAVLVSTEAKAFPATAEFPNDAGLCFRLKSTSCHHRMRLHPASHAIQQSMQSHAASSNPCNYMVQHARLHFRKLQGCLALVYSLVHHHLNMVVQCQFRSYPSWTGRQTP